MNNRMIVWELDHACFVMLVFIYRSSLSMSSAIVFVKAVEDTLFILRGRSKQQWNDSMHRIKSKIFISGFSSTRCNGTVYGEAEWIGKKSVSCCKICVLLVLHHHLLYDRFLGGCFRGWEDLLVPLDHRDSTSVLKCTWHSMRGGSDWQDEESVLDLRLLRLDKIGLLNIGFSGETGCCSWISPSFSRKGSLITIIDSERIRSIVDGNDDSLIVVLFVRLERFLVVVVLVNLWAQTANQKADEKGNRNCPLRAALSPIYLMNGIIFPNIGK